MGTFVVIVMSWFEWLVVICCQFPQDCDVQDITAVALDGMRGHNVLGLVERNYSKTGADINLE